MRRIEALQQHAAAIERRCRVAGDRDELRAVRTALDEAQAWLRTAAPPQAVLVTHVAKMVNGACERLYAVSQSVG